MPRTWDNERKHEELVERQRIKRKSSLSSQGAPTSPGTDQGAGAPAPQDDEGDDDDEVELRSPEPMNEDIYSAVIIGLISDSMAISRLPSNSRPAKVRKARSATTMGLLLLNISIQIFLLVQIKRYVTSKAVHDIRKVYDAYEFHMYGGQENHTYISRHGFHRGKPGYFNPDLFDSEKHGRLLKGGGQGGGGGGGGGMAAAGGVATLAGSKSGNQSTGAQHTVRAFTAGTREAACNIPLSQPKYLLVVLFIWSLTCMGEIKTGIETMFTFFMTTKTLGSMENAIVEDDGMKIVDGLTPLLKVVLFVILSVRLVVTCFLLWLGSRWLIATADFSSILMNAVGLEFVLSLKDLLYESTVPARNQREVQNIWLRPRTKKEPASMLVFLGTFLWGLLAWAWAILYMYYIQDVLPDYQWDVSRVCSAYIEAEYGS